MERESVSEKRSVDVTFFFYFLKRFEKEHNRNFSSFLFVAVKNTMIGSFD
jgi:hypothetical protein